ncbi:Exonuclease 3'-5' domain-containing protein 1 [Galdieria sulphuraria]|uniref:3'-5' exonuclease domain-containing protein / KH domain-containing protein n=1 Tax=Galdieria sulphuraria TaxID=130081 RepID=M2XBK0_GALSU|nr:3'-5' exonuclease domain-containing protein / KH domain-containing protein [Galdieria sulphuraria]EME27272.1 3'-5' exonuclease domain-containing protein / KH domain-containing protein [Galdieria sulphuraria]GJD11330.1 Exonuclease 3'-5' domain-containing protein 1 [Galdieria sulphuraria]|eukprot:XP_005703792.1 3'-5' exonuclease domain-containing protein / KH domain-containing protein [Galdieria sulphuraria]
MWNQVEDDFELVTQPGRVKNIINETLGVCDAIAVDCEGVNLSRDGKLCLLQVSTGTKTFIFDVCALQKELFLTGFKEILESERILKVFHDCRYDSDALWWLYGVRLRNVLDTQVAFRILREQQGYTRQLPVKFITLLRRFVNQEISPQTLELKRTFKNRFSQDRNFWLRRPIPKDALVYAAYDVKKLLEIATNILRNLSEWNRKRVMDESEIYVMAYRDDEEGALKARMEFGQIRTSLEMKQHNLQQNSNIWDSFLFDKNAILRCFTT